MSLPFTDWLPMQRWYAGRGRELVTAAPAVVTALRDGLTRDADRRHLCRRCHGALPGAGRRTAPVAEYAELAHIGSDGGRVGYDALYDPAAMLFLLSLIAGSAARDDVVFRAEPLAELPVDAPPRVLSAEQSNTSVIFGQRAILKVFRRVTPGVSPDIELNRALAGRAARTPHGCWGPTKPVGAPSRVRWEWSPPSPPIRPTDGTWRRPAPAICSPRATFTPTRWVVLRAESHRLGQAVASVHRALVEQFGASMVVYPAETALRRLDRLRPWCWI